MQTTIVLLVLTQLVIAAAAALGPKLKIPAPLILVLCGIGASLIPGTPEFEIDAHLILLGLLPPLLYASATSIPVMNLRRDLGAINSLSIVLVVLSALALGTLFAWLIPGLGFTWGVALGAILSPTDAVATSIIKGRGGVPSRVAVLLDGEGLLNDASALIVLRTAIVATSVGFSFWTTVGSFALSIIVAVAIGVLAARINLAIRRRVREEAVNTILSFTTPFAAAIPAEMLHGSGLVAAVCAGFVVAIRGPRELPPGHRMSDAQNWATVQIVLEGLIFLTMGLQLSGILRQLQIESSGFVEAVGIAMLALLATVAVRAAYVVPLLLGSNRRARRMAAHPRVEKMRRELAARQLGAETPTPSLWRLDQGGRFVRRLATRMRRYIADIDYLLREPLGRAEVTVVIWAGMRGAVTVAAVQLLPDSTPHRPLLVFIAFAVATMSLLLQGGSLGLIVGRLFPGGDTAAISRARAQERARIQSFLNDVAAQIARSPDTSDQDHRLALLKHQRVALLDARDEGLFEAAALEAALLDVDVDEMVLELRGR